MTDEEIVGRFVHTVLSAAARTKLDPGAWYNKHNEPWDDLTVECRNFYRTVGREMLANPPLVLANSHQKTAGTGNPFYGKHKAIQ